MLTGREETASSCAKGGLDWISRKNSSPKELSSTGAGCPGKWLSHHPWRYLKDMQVWRLGTWFSGGLGLGSARLTVGLSDHKGRFQPK